MLAAPKLKTKKGAEGSPFLKTHSDIKPAETLSDVRVLYIDTQQSPNVILRVLRVHCSFAPCSSAHRFCQQGLVRQLKIRSVFVT